MPRNSPGHESTRLECGHISKHVQVRLREQHRADCPCCKSAISVKDQKGMGLRRPPHRFSPQDAPSARPRPPSAAERRSLARAGRSLDIRYCPECNRPILKQGGCGQMTCLCGHRFRWAEAMVATPCRHPHRDEDHPWWGTTCRQCSAAARAEAMVVRAGLTTVAVPVVAGVVGLVGAVVALALPTAIAVATVPAVMCAPPALAWEAFDATRRLCEERGGACEERGGACKERRDRAHNVACTLPPWSAEGAKQKAQRKARRETSRRRTSRKNPFKAGMVSGAYAAGVGCFILTAYCVGYESD